MNIAERIITRFGGAAKLAALLEAPPTTVHSWKDRGFIPAKRQGEVLKAAERAGVELAPADFFEGATP